MPNENGRWQGALVGLCAIYIGACGGGSSKGATGGNGGTAGVAGLAGAAGGAGAAAAGATAGAAGSVGGAGGTAAAAPASLVGTADCQGGCAINGAGEVLCFAFTCPACSSTPTAVSMLTAGVTAVTVGGSNAENSTGNNPEPTSTSAQGTGAFGCTDNFACAVQGGDLWCWGANAYGSLGNGTTTDSAVPVQVMGLVSGVTVVSAASQNSFACAVADGNVYCWGRNDAGQLGAGATAAMSPVPVQVPGLAGNAVSVSAGNTYACALTSAGAVLCWGDNTYGQLGNGTKTSSGTPVAVSGLAAGVKSLSTGVNYACAVLGGAVMCWGNNGLTTPSTVPVAISQWSAGATQVSSGLQHVCAVIGGGVQCFGENAQGSLGDGTTTPSSVPVQVSGLTGGVATMTAGDASFACSIKTDGSLWCWGGLHHTPFAISGF
jgi:hypothetical protein